MFQFQFHRILFNQNLALKKLWCYFRGESAMCYKLKLLMRELGAIDEKIIAYNKKF